MAKRLNADRKQNGGAIQHIFPLIAVTGYRYHAVRCVELINYFLHFRYQRFLCVFHCQNKSI